MQATRSILALDATTSLCSAAWTDGQRWVERVEDAGHRHSELMLGMVDAVLGEAGCMLSGLTEIAFGAGPGSFTGLRIACGVAQGLALGAALPVRPVSSLMALAQASGARAALVALDARMDEVYWAAFARSATHDRWDVVVAPRVSPPQEFAIPDGEGWMAGGDGFAAYPGLASRIGATIRIDPGLRVTARAIAELALAGEAALVDAALAAPHYVRDKVALTAAERGAAAAARAGAD
jgi:tRNA threonylcarbamoyladenosine biosynthesis protein TsaB